MIDEKIIDEGARDYINKNGYFIKYDEDPCVDIEYAYKDGAHWAINEFLEDLWHPAIKAPDLDRRILYEYKPNGEINPHTHIREATYEKIRWKECGYKPINPERIITRWLYVDDLLPKKGGAE